MEELELILAPNKRLIISPINSDNRLLVLIENYDSEIVFRLDLKDAGLIVNHLKKQFGI